MNYSMLSCLQWIRLDADILETMPRKMEDGGEKIVLVCVDTLGLRIQFKRAKDNPTDICQQCVLLQSCLRSDKMSLFSKYVYF